jgi:predicted DNA-binding protein YlxM (UPF0122 family)
MALNQTERVRFLLALQAYYDGNAHFREAAKEAETKPTSLANYAQSLNLPLLVQPETTLAKAAAKKVAELLVLNSVSKQYFENFRANNRNFVTELAHTLEVTKPVAIKILGRYGVPSTAERLTIDPEWLRTQYVQKQRTMQEIADELGKSVYAVFSAIHRNEIPVRKLNVDLAMQKIFTEKMLVINVAAELNTTVAAIRSAFYVRGIYLPSLKTAKAPIDRVRLYKSYIEERKNLTTIAEELATTVRHVESSLSHHSIPKTPRWQRCFNGGFEELQPEQQQLLLGTLLGDASINQGSSTSASLGLGQKQSEYLKWKISLLPEFFSGDIHTCTRFDKRASKSYTMYSASSYRHPIFAKLRTQLYPKGVKILSNKVLERLEAFGVAVLVMDDGCGNKTWPGQISISTYSFTKEENERLCRWFAEKYQIYPTVYHVPRGYYYLGFTGENPRRLANLIRPYLLPLFVYKTNVRNPYLWPSFSRQSHKIKVGFNWLHEQYVEKRRSAREIASKLKVSDQTVLRALHKNKIATRNGRPPSGFGIALPQGARFEELFNKIQDLNIGAFQRAIFIKQLRDQSGLSQREIAAQLKRSRSWVANHLRLLQLNEKLPEALLNQLSEGAARGLLSISKEKLDQTVAEYARLIKQGEPITK